MTRCQLRSGQRFLESGALLNGSGASAEHEKKTTVKGKALLEQDLKPGANLLLDLGKYLWL